MQKKQEKSAQGSSVFGCAKWMGHPQDRDEFKLEIVDTDGNVVTKGVKKEGEGQGAAQKNEGAAHSGKPHS